MNTLDDINAFISILNQNLKCLKQEKLYLINDLIDDELLLKILCEIEPDFKEKIKLKEHVRDRSTNKLVVKSNFEELIRALGTYLTTISEREKFTEMINITNFLKAESLIGHDKKSITVLFEYIICLTYISSTRDFWFDIFINRDNYIAQIYLSTIDKFIKMEDYSSNQVKSEVEVGFWKR